MEITVCKEHKEQVEQAGDGIELGICPECGQAIQYDGRKQATVVKLGRIGDKLVLPTNPSYELLLDPRDQQDLASVDKAPPVLGVVPPKPQTGGMHAVKRYYEENKGPILHDLDTSDEKATCKRWNMRQATFLGLMARWRPDYPGLPKWAIEKAQRIRVKPAARTKRPGPREKLKKPKPPSDVKSLPEFPPFNVKWQSSVQEKWLETYLELSKIGRGVK